MSAIRLDHVAIGLWRWEDAVELFEERLGGARSGGYDGVPFGFRQWEFAGGGRLEIVYPEGPPDGFLHRFLARGGPRIHHATFKVPSLDDTIARARERGYDVVGIDRREPHWQEAFLHPKSAQGIVVQMVEQRPREGGEDWPTARPRSDAARIRGLRLSARSAEAARRQWGELLGGSGFVQGDALSFRWEESPLALLVDVDPDREEGPLQLELSAARDLALPDSPFPGFGTRFVQV
ncbi:MAG TPA: VOC family protein [Myxococcota bacterium]|nr:VOC family protein [Myxococcota bacterium]